MQNHNDLELLRNAVKTTPLLCSVFDRITPNGEPPPKKRNPLHARILTAQNIVSEDGNMSVDALEKDISIFKDLQEGAQKDTYYYLLQKYGWRIGRPGLDEDELQDEALCDFIRTERALELPNDASNYLLVKGDLAGIQDYIYGGIQQKTSGGLTNLAKRLRGRSILVTLLTDFLANVILRELELPLWNLLFAGGGHFNLLLPDTEANKNKLKDLTFEIDGELRRWFEDRLQLIVAPVSCSKEDLTQQAGKCFELLNAERERKKYRRHNDNLLQHFYPTGPKMPSKEKDAREMRIGERFPKMNVLVETVSDRPIFDERNSSELLIALNLKNYTYSLLAAEDTRKAEQLLENVGGLVSAQVFTLNDTGFLPEKSAWSGKIGRPVSFGFRFIGRYVPTIDAENPKSGKLENRPKTFEEIADTDALKMLGAIRLDVDDLGFIFNHGMANATLAQIITLSRELHYFFSACFDQLAEKHGIYLIYSGGDDAFAVGQWKKLIDFALDLQKDFKTFVFKNGALHFSAGIFFGDPKYPVGRFYLDTEALLNEAKQSNEQKDRVDIFHRVIKWEAFEKKIIFGENLSASFSREGDKDGVKMTKAFAYKLLNLVRTSFYERSETENGVNYKRGSLNTRRFARNIGSMRYLFARNGYNKAKTDEVLKGLENELITDFLRNFDFGKEQSIHDNLVALNYALYTIRSQKETNQ